MRILYLNVPDHEDCVADSILYGLRMKLGKDLLDYPKKELMYKSCTVPDDKIYGNAFLLWKTLPEIERPITDVLEDMFRDKFDVVIFSDIYRMQDVFSHFTVYKYFEKTNAKFIFLDGSDDGFPTVYDALKRGTYFKRENPFNYPNIQNIGISIPEKDLRKDKPPKTRLFTTHIQCDEAFNLKWIKDNCTKSPVFKKKEDYYNDLASSYFGITMKKSGWDTPRHMENAAHRVVNCIYNKGWDWDPVDFYHKPSYTHPKGFEDMKNCVIWNDTKELANKINYIKENKLFDAMSDASYEWVKTKTCEKMAEYVLNYV